MATFEFKTKQETKTWAQDFARQLTRPALVLLSGDMGAGKTQLIRWFAEALGAAAVSSPTFTIHQSYQTPDGYIEHLDLYRVENIADFESAGLWDLLKESESLIFIEWPEKLPEDIWPKDRAVFRLSFSVYPDESRKISVTQK